MQLKLIKASVKEVNSNRNYLSRVTFLVRCFFLLGLTLSLRHDFQLKMHTS